MAGELIKRDLGALDNRRHSKDERSAIDAQRFGFEMARQRLAADAQEADDTAELGELLVSRAKGRTAARHRETALLLSTTPDSAGLAMAFGELDAVAHHIEVSAVLKFQNRA